MNRTIKLIAWDHDRVLIPSLVTSELAIRNTLSSDPFLAELLCTGRVSPSDIEQWCQSENRQIAHISDLADFLTDSLYDMSGPDGTSLLTKSEVIEQKQKLLRGLSVADIYRAMEEIPLTEGINKVVGRCHARNISQIIISDTLDIAVRWQVNRLGMTAGFGVPAVLDLEGIQLEQEATQELAAPWPREARLSGKVLPFNKARCLWTFCDENRVRLSEVAVVDDSAANIEALFRPILEAHGLAIAFGPSAKDEEAFLAIGIPVIHREDTAILQEMLTKYT
ncbi:MAG: HAD family hydrolase [Planctomycetota bacterium]